jgi:poly(beta-D-mannuronate) lyase
MPPYFTPTGDQTGVQFRAPVNGATTPGSSYPRSELREMAADRVPAAWSSTQGTNRMSLREAITHLPGAKPEMIAGQIHDANGYVVAIRLDGTRLYVEHDGQDIGELNPNYVLGTIFRLRMVAAGGLVSVYYNDKAPITFPVREGGLYFKAGCYTQSNLTKGEAPDAYGEVDIYDLRVSHT